MRAASQLLAVVGVLLASRPAAADNPHLARARLELDGLRFDEARGSLEQALRAGVNGRGELAEIYRLTGQVLAVLGDTAGADASFRRLLALSPTAQLPAGTSPKIAAPFQTAQAYIHFHKLQPLAARVDLPAREPLVVTVFVDSDPFGMVSGARVTFWNDAGAEQRSEARGGGTISVDVPGARRLVVHVVDQWGNRLVEAGTQDAPLALELSAPATGGGGKDTPSRPIYTRYYLWYAVALGFGAAGTWFGLQASASQDELDELNSTSAMHDFSDAKAVQDRGERQALIANISFATAGVFAAVGTVFLVRDLMGGKREKPSETAVRAAPALLPDGAGLVITGGW